MDRFVVPMAVVYEFAKEFLQFFRSFLFYQTQSLRLEAAIAN